MIPNLFCPVYMYEGSCALLQSYCKGRVQSDVYATVLCPEKGWRLKETNFEIDILKNINVYTMIIKKMVLCVLHLNHLQNKIHRQRIFFYELRM